MPSLEVRAPQGLSLGIKELGLPAARRTVQFGEVLD
jgi:hypothetical protein